jgi:hypothetical protein
VLTAYAGDDQSRTLTWRLNLATALSDLGRKKEAVAEYRAVTEICAEELAERPDTPANRDELAAAQARVEYLKGLERMVGAFESTLPTLQELSARARRMQEDDIE